MLSRARNGQIIIVSMSAIDEEEGLVNQLFPPPLSQDVFTLVGMLEAQKQELIDMVYGEEMDLPPPEGPEGA